MLISGEYEFRAGETTPQQKATLSPKHAAPSQTKSRALLRTPSSGLQERHLPARHGAGTLGLPTGASPSRAALGNNGALSWQMLGQGRSGVCSMLLGAVEAGELTDPITGSWCFSAATGIWPRSSGEGVMLGWKAAWGL